MNGKGWLLITIFAAASSPIAAQTQVRLEVAAGISGSADMGSRSPRLAAQAAAVFPLGTPTHSLGVEAGYWGNAGSETMVMLRLVPGDPIPPPPGDTALGAIATDLGSWTLGGVHRPRPAALGARIGVDLGVGGARTAVTRRLRITDYNGNYLGTDAPTETAWGGYARVGVIVDVQRLTRTLGIYLGIDGAAMSVGGERRRSGESRPESASDWVTSRGRPRRR